MLSTVDKMTDVRTNITTADVLKPLRYHRPPGSIIQLLNAARGQKRHNDTLIVALIFCIFLVLFVLAYFALFIYQRIRYPKSEPEDQTNFVRRGARKSGVGSLNQVVTKDELLGKGTLDTTTDWAETGLNVQRGDQERHEQIKVHSSSREGPSDAQSDASEETSTSARVVRHEFPIKEETNEVEDGPEKISMPSSDRVGKFRMSGEFNRWGLDDPNCRKQTKDEKRRRDYIMDYAEAYRFSVRREGRYTGQQRVQPQSMLQQHTDLGKLNRK